MTARCPAAPYRVDLEPNKRYLWCACGLSKRQPFCDFSHTGTGVEPVAFTAPERLTVALCGCKRTAAGPYCDGAHAHGGDKPDQV
jgi:CDGSH-type Zn-finger protein